MDLMAANNNLKQKRISLGIKPKTHLKKITTKDSITKEKYCYKHGKIKTSLFGQGVLLCVDCVEETDLKVTQSEAFDRKKETEKEQIKINKLLDNAMLSPRFRAKTFKNYNLYMPEIRGQKKALEVTKEFAKNITGKIGIVMIGARGNGKNHLVSAIINEIAKQGKTALITEAIKIFRAIKESWKSSAVKSETEILAGYRAPSLLVIDEIGVQYGSPTEMRLITEIINDRYNWLLPTILIGNKTIIEIKNLIGESALDRFNEGGEVIVFNWESYRGKEK